MQWVVSYLPDVHNTHKLIQGTFRHYKEYIQLPHRNPTKGSETRKGELQATWPVMPKPTGLRFPHHRNWEVEWGMVT